MYTAPFNTKVNNIQVNFYNQAWWQTPVISPGKLNQEDFQVGEVSQGRATQQIQGQLDYITSIPTKKERGFFQGSVKEMEMGSDVGSANPELSSFPDTYTNYPFSLALDPPSLFRILQS